MIIFCSKNGNLCSRLMNVLLLDYIDLLKLLKTPKNTNSTKFWKRRWNQDWIYFNFEKLMETFRCYKIGFFLTNIGVFVLVRIVSLCRISKWKKVCNIRPVIKNKITVWMRQSLIQGGGVKICQGVSFAFFGAFWPPNWSN